MRPVNNNLLTPGKFIIVWRIIKYVHENIDYSDIKILTSVLHETGLFGGTIPVIESCLLGQTCELFKVQAGKIYLTEYSITELIPLCDDKEPNQAVIRKILHKLITTKRIHWILFYNDDIEIFKTAIPKEWIELLENSNLFTFDDLEVIDWWKQILESFHEYDEKKKKEIGDIGEKLTIEFEKDRLVSDGIDNPQIFVKWVARFSNSYGYDVLSIRAKLLKGQYQLKDQIKVEVKASVISQETSFPFKVSRNEWNTALQTLESYYFYFWAGINLKNSTAKKGPYIIPAKDFLGLIPSDQSIYCEWTECKFTIDLTKYSLL